jgi:hypothetical protein
MRQSHPLMLVILCYILTLCFCQACTDPNCLTCPTVTVCTLCNYGFALNSTTSNCSQCTASNQTIQNNFCYAIPANCQQYPINPNDNTTLICIQCNANYAFNSSTNTSCTLCNNASVTVYNNTCYNSTPNCALYQMSSTPGTLVCTQCNAHYAFNYSAPTSCIKCDDASATIQNNTCYNSTLNCALY